MPIRLLICVPWKIDDESDVCKMVSRVRKLSQLTTRIVLNTPLCPPRQRLTHHPIRGVAAELPKSHIGAARRHRRKS